VHPPFSQRCRESHKLRAVLQGSAKSHYQLPATFLRCPRRSLPLQRRSFQLPRTRRSHPAPRRCARCEQFVLYAAASLLTCRERAVPFQLPETL